MVRLTSLPPLSHHDARPRASAMWQRHLGRLTTASLAGGVAAAYHRASSVQAAPDRPQFVSGEQQMRLQLLGQAVQQAQGLLTEPPVALQRFGKAWMQYVQPEDVNAFHLARDALRAVLTDTSELPVSSIDDEVVTGVHMAVRAAGAAVERLRAAAALQAARRPWHGLMGGRTLERARGGGGVPVGPGPSVVRSRGARRSRAARGQRSSCNFQRVLGLRRLGMRFAEYAYPHSCDGLERLHAFVKIVERGASIQVDRPRVNPPHPERVYSTFSESASRHGDHFAQQRPGFFEAP